MTVVVLMYKITSLAELGNSDVPGDVLGDQCTLMDLSSNNFNLCQILSQEVGVEFARYRCTPITGGITGHLCLVTVVGSFEMT